MSDTKPKKKKISEVEKLKKELETLNDKYLRALAEIRNINRRSYEEVEHIKKYEGRELIIKLLDVVDDFERAITTYSNASEDVKKFLSGFEMIYAAFIGLLKDAGVHEVDCINKEFDPTLADALLTEKKKGIEKNIVTDVMQKGYAYKDKVIRPAKVKVSE